MAPGETVSVQVVCEPRLFTWWDEQARSWQDLHDGELLVARGLGDVRSRVQLERCPGRDAERERRFRRLPHPPSTIAARRPPPLGREFGATDIVEERGDARRAKTKEPTDGLGARSVIEAVGTEEPFLQAIRFTAAAATSASSAWPMTAWKLPMAEVFVVAVHLHGGPRRGALHLPELIRLIWNRKIDPGRVFDLVLPLGPGRRRLQGDGRAPRYQDLLTL